MPRPIRRIPLIRGALELEARTLIMGVINVTPDSFSDGGRFLTAEKAVTQGRRLLDEGADILDVGGESTRPGSSGVTADEEMARVLPVIEALAQTGAVVSIDTSKAEVARAAIEAGAQIINDVAAFRLDPDLPGLAATSGAAVVLMHMLGTPKTMQEAPVYRDVAAEVRDFLDERARSLLEAGTARDKIILDPGIGFGKTTEHNLVLIRRLDVLAELGFPVLLGASRKRFIGALTGREDTDDRLWGTLGVHVAGALLGADIVRVHDVAPLRDALIMADAIAAAGGRP